MEGSSHDSQGKRIASHPTMQSNRGSLPDNDDVGEGQHGRMDDLTKSSLKELRGRLQQEATAYLQQERRVIINEELNKLREHRFLQRTMEEFNAADGHHHRWLREHQRVMDVMHKVRERSQTAESKKQQSFLEKENKLESKMKNFFRSRMQLNQAKKQRNKQRIDSRPATSYYHQSQLGRTQPIDKRASPKHNQVSINRDSNMSSRSQRVSSMQQVKDKQHLQTYMSKLRKAEQRIICLQINNEKSRRDGRSKPTKILSSLRDSRYQQTRQQNEKTFFQRIESHEVLLSRYQRQQEAIIEQRKDQQNRHREEVSVRHSRFRESDMQRRLADVSNVDHRSRELQLRRQRSQKIVSMRKLFQVKKHKEIEQHNSQLERLRAKLHNLSLLDSSQLLNEKEMQESVRLVKQLTNDSQKCAQIFIKKKEELVALPAPPAKNSAVKLR